MSFCNSSLTSESSLPLSRPTLPSPTCYLYMHAVPPIIWSCLRAVPSWTCRLYGRGLYVYALYYLPAPHFLTIQYRASPYAFWLWILKLMLKLTFQPSWGQGAGRGHWQIRELPVSFKAPRPIQIATESPFNVENDGAYLRCKIWGVPGRYGTPLQKIPVFYIENTGNCS